MKIVFIGDSITDANHNYSENALGEGYVKIVAENLQGNHEIINKGHDGFTVFGLWKFLNHDCISKNPDIVSILVGCNDVSIKMSTGKTLEEQEFQKIYEKLLERICKKTNAKIICMGPFIFPHPLEFENWIPDIKKAEQIVRKISGKYNAVFLPLHDCLNDAALKFGYEKITTDGTHLTMKGARIVAEKWLNATTNWLDKKAEIS